jgi:hypothetical protein
LNVPKILDEIPVQTIRKFARKAYRYIDCYRERDGIDNSILSPNIVEWNVTQYKSHRRIDRLLKIEEKLKL